MKELTLRGSMEYPARFADAIDLLGRRDLSRLITDRFPLERFAEALREIRDRTARGRVVLTMQK
jgi:threonine dehydrogenase-like Zn-dependent dehydrogenase